MKKTLAKLLLIIAFGIGFYFVYLNSHYANVLPKQPEPNVGRIYVLNVHGTIVYLTAQENSLLTYLQFGALGCGICGGLLWKRSEGD